MFLMSFFMLMNLLRIGILTSFRSITHLIELKKTAFKMLINYEHYFLRMDYFIFLLKNEKSMKANLFLQCEKYSSHFLKKVGCCKHRTGTDTYVHGSPVREISLRPFLKKSQAHLKSKHQVTKFNKIFC